MGMYTELNIGVRLKRNTPAAVINVINHMASREANKPEMQVIHPFMASGRWSWMFACDSYYFDGKTQLIWRFDDISEAYFLTTRFNVKNYQDEIEGFLEFIAPHLESEGYIGTYRFEEDDHPTLLYAEDGKILWRKIE